jgi:response regulator RpfG family c-di-GMP phosphodiesterase
MEERDSGLKVAEWIRKTLGNKRIRIVLRTGQPGDAPENSVIKTYDINDYKLKTELTQQKLFSTLYSSLRSYRDIVTLEKSRQNLQNIVKIGSELFSARSLDDFLKGMLDQVSQLLDDSVASLVVQIRPGLITDVEKSGMIVRGLEGAGEIVAATGKFRPLVGQKVSESEATLSLHKHIQEFAPRDGEMIQVVEGGLLIYSQFSNTTTRNFIFLEEPVDRLDLDQVKLFLTNFSLTLDNFYLNQFVQGLQDDLLFMFAETIERHFKESSHHVRRVSLMVRELAHAYGLSPDLTETIRLASILHDMGKIGIPDEILKKPGRLNDVEMAVMRTHTNIGCELLSRSDLPLFRMGARIAKHHHEHWSGREGYPDKINGDTIPLEARMTAIADVFDALVNSRVYKEAWPPQDAVAELRNGAGKMFDPKLIDLFLERIDVMLEIQKTYEG